ncbi:uncharacterized protein HD556DRAFT_1232984, partial [Suillus plorans]
EATDDPSAKMQWTHFHNVVQRYQVVMEGWPKKIPFMNLSQSSSALADLEMLWCKWDANKIYWRALSDEEFAELHKECEDKLESGELVDCHHCQRSDKGKKHNIQMRGSLLLATSSTGARKLLLTAMTVVWRKRNQFVSQQHHLVVLLQLSVVLVLVQPLLMCLILFHSLLILVILVSSLQMVILDPLTIISTFPCSTVNHCCLS